MWFGHSKWTKNTLCLFRRVCVCKWQGLITALIRPSLHSTHNHTLTRLLAVVSQCLCYAGLLFRKHCNTQQSWSVTTAAWLRMIYLGYLRYFSWTAHTGSFELYLRQQRLCLKVCIYTVKEPLWHSLTLSWAAVCLVYYCTVLTCLFLSQVLWTTFARSLSLMSQPLNPAVPPQHTLNTHTHTKMSSVQRACILNTAFSREFTEIVHQNLKHFDWPW